MVRSREENSIGLALSGGGCRSVAHLGMMQALIEQGFSLSRIAGSSAGRHHWRVALSRYYAQRNFENS